MMEQILFQVLGAFATGFSGTTIKVAAVFSCGRKGNF